MSRPPRFRSHSHKFPPHEAGTCGGNLCHSHVAGTCYIGLVYLQPHSCFSKAAHTGKYKGLQGVTRGVGLQPENLADRLL
eukprot:394359-Pelagomonas_calceolata.AAC.1